MGRWQGREQGCPQGRTMEQGVGQGASGGLQGGWWQVRWHSWPHFGSRTSPHGRPQETSWVEDASHQSLFKLNLISSKFFVCRIFNTQGKNKMVLQ